MKKIFTILISCFVIVAVTFCLLAYFNSDEGFFTLYNIMNGLTCGGGAVILIFAFLGKKGSKPVVNFPASIGFGHVGKAFTQSMQTADNMMYSADPKLMMKSVKPQLDPKPNVVGIERNEDSPFMQRLIFILPFAVGAICLMIGLSYLINVTV